MIASNERAATWCHRLNEKRKKIISVVPRWLYRRKIAQQFVLPENDVECRETRNIINKCDSCDTEKNSVWAKCHINFKKGALLSSSEGGRATSMRVSLTLSWMTKVLFFIEEFFRVFYTKKYVMWFIFSSLKCDKVSCKKNIEIFFTHKSLLSPSLILSQNYW